MTDRTDLAAALLRDVERWRPEHPGVMVPDPNGVWVDRRHVLAALSRALDPAIAERAGEVVERLRGRPDAIEDVDRLRDEAADLITAFLAQNAALRAERDEARVEWERCLNRANENYAALPAEKGKAEKLRAERDEHRANWERAFNANTALEERLTAAEAKVKKLRAERDDALTFLDNAVSKAPDPLKALGKYLAGRLDEDEWPTAEQYLNAAAKACANRATAALTTEESK